MEEYREVALAYRDSARKANAHLDLNLVRHVKSKTKTYRYISSKMKIREYVWPTVKWGQGNCRQRKQKMLLYHSL